MRTGQQIVSDFMTMIRKTVLADVVNGGIYRGGTRPRGSSKEDITVTFTTADAEQYQSGVITINIFVPQLAGVMGNGTWVENSVRCQEIEESAQESLQQMKELNTNYYLSLQNAIYTQREDDIHQSMIVMRIRFKYID